MAVGEPIRLADDYVERLGSAARTTAGEVFVAIAVKFFAVPEAEVTGVWRGGKGRKPEEAGG